MIISIKRLLPILYAILYSAAVPAENGFYLRFQVRTFGRRYTFPHGWASPGSVYFNEIGASPSNTHFKGSEFYIDSIASGEAWARGGLKSNEIKSYTPKDPYQTFACYTIEPAGYTLRLLERNAERIEFASKYKQDATGQYKSVEDPSARVYALVLWSDWQNACDRNPDLIVLLQPWSNDGEKLHNIVFFTGTDSVLETQWYEFSEIKTWSAFRVITVAERDTVDGYYVNVRTRRAQWDKNTLALPSEKDNYSKEVAGFSEKEIMYSTFSVAEQEDADESNDPDPRFHRIISMKVYEEEKADGQREVQEPEKEQSDNGLYWVQDDKQFGEMSSSLSEETLGKTKEVEEKREKRMKEYKRLRSMSKNFIKGLKKTY